MRRPRIRKRVVLAVYLALLAASHAVRASRPEPPPPPGLSLQEVEGWPQPKRGPVTIAYREWWTDSTGNLSSSDKQAMDSARTPVDDESLVTDSITNLSGNLSRDADAPEVPVLLLHGSPGSGGVFRRLGSVLGVGRRAIAPDLPGFGGSTTKIPDYSIRAHAAMTLQLLDSLAIGRAHVVGFSLGGGVALEMYRADNARIASITLLSSIGAQEYELLGEYHLNHAIHGLQLFAIWTLRELVPHFGYADDAFLSHSYARNFFDTDQRPLRGILRGYQGPMLIVHGADDPLVPAAAAEEHHRIVPQSEMVMPDGNHFMTFLEPDRIAPPIEDFLDRVEAGTASVRATAEPARAAAAATPFDPSTVPPVMGFALLVTLLLIVAATFVSEDLTCIGTGLLIARDILPWMAGVGACLVGLVVGDLLLYAGGRLIGRPVTRIAPLRWMIREEELERACRWFTRRSAALLIGGRFVPGTRLPTYVAAGVVRMPLIPFSLWIAVAAVLWTPLLVGGTALFGAVAAERIGVLQHRALPWLIVTALGALIALRAGVPLLSAAGRRRFLARWGRARRWEFWPPWLFYPPVLAWGAWLALKYRSLTVFTAANPAFPDGGLVGESKSEILGAIGERARVARTVVAGEGGAVADAVGGLPVVVKPDVGERGAGVAIVRSEEALRARLDVPGRKLIVQEYVPGEELGVFYYRFPGEERGRIFGITGKRPPVVTGDGRRSLGDLVLEDRRLRCQRRVFGRTLGAGLDRVPGPGERVVLEERGNHCFGCEFRDDAHLETPALAAAIDEVSRSIDGFFFGRYDIRGETMADIQAGRFKVIELNGVSSEATNIYDPRGTLRAAYRTLFRQWELAFRIGAANRALGARATPALPLLGRLFRHFRPSGARWARPEAQSSSPARDAG
ncbi:MAG: alpha/beta fold hydrolase [Gemmatimonadota bacterium]|nr:alpha/beta fold hydrolase [Gemmatimonadota bacterium]